MDVYLVNDTYTVRALRENDFDKGYIDLLRDLTVVDGLDSDLFREIFLYQNSRPHQYVTIVIEENCSGIIVGNGVIFVSQQCGFKHGMIEDIVVLKRLQGKGLGKLIIDILLGHAKRLECQKVTLDCSEENIGFYQKCGLVRCGVGIGLYF